MYIDLLILAELGSRPYHGYELKRQVEWILGEALNSNHLYPALRRFEERGAIVQEVERQPGRPDRHVYHLTEQGEHVLHTLLREFPAQLAGNDREFQTRFAFFHLLDGASRLAILTTRRAALLERLQHREEARSALAVVCEQPQATYAQSLLELHIRQIQQELEWIATHLEEAQH